MSNPAIIDALLANEYAGVSELVGEPILNRTMLPSYELVIRTLKYAQEDLNEDGEPVDPDVSWITEVVLEGGEQIPVTVIGSATITPDYEMMQLDPDEPVRGILMIREADLTPEQAKQARWFIRRRAPK